MTDFKQGTFRITFEGPMGSGKTVALKKVKDYLILQGYEVKQDLESEKGFEHTLAVRWKADS